MVQGSYSGLSNYRILLEESHDPPGIYFRLPFEPFGVYGPRLGSFKGPQTQTEPHNSGLEVWEFRQAFAPSRH